MHRKSFTLFTSMFLLFSLLATVFTAVLGVNAEQASEYNPRSNHQIIHSTVMATASASPSDGSPLSIMGYHNLTEVEIKLHRIAQNYPAIAKLYDLGKLYPWPNGTPKQTVQNRSVYALKLSDNPGINESTEPDILYVSLHHAREWITVEVILYVLDYFLNNYQTNTTLGNIINTTELWFVPVMNPDGFHYSQYGRDDINNTNSNQWRKNCNETNGNPGFQDNDWARGDGVDLNRNYGYQWGYDNMGSSGNPNDVTYRGSAPFSEVETQLIRDFSLDMKFKLAISYHSYSQLILFPWSYDDFDTPHDALFNEIAKNMAQYNNYRYGNPKDGVIYNCNGEALDWLYHNLTCLAFTFELGTVFIPSPSLIPSICQKNLEPSILIAKLADDPYKIFKSGISGHVTNSQGMPLAGVNISTTYATDNLSCVTNATGHYQLRHPPGTFGLHAEKDGYWLRSLNDVLVQVDKYTTKDFTMIDSVPPVVSAVWAETNGEPGTDFSIGSIVRINVVEEFGEENLTGTIEIESVSQSYTSGDLTLEFDDSTDHYYYLWNTTKLHQGEDYVVEVDLQDYDFNVDANGSNDTGPDLILSLLDHAAPVVWAVDTLNLKSVPTADTDERYELGSIVRIIVYEVFNERWLNGTVRLVSANASYDSGLQELTFDSQENYYYWDWFTSDLEPADDYGVETTLRDKWGNIDNDGLLSSPDIVITLEDTTPPVITRVDSMVGTDNDEMYELGSLVKIIIEVQEYEDGLTGYVNISSTTPGYEISLTDLDYSVSDEYFYVLWASDGLEVAEEYVVETAMADKYSNYDLDGSKGSTPDLIIGFHDTTPPEVSSVTSFVALDDDNRYEAGSEVWFIVREAKAELNLTGTISIHSRTQDYYSGAQELLYSAVLDGYVWVWNTSSKAIVAADDYWVETTLSDRFGNIDFDGLPASPDLIIALDDTTAPEIIVVWSFVGYDTDNNYEVGSTVRLVVEERFAEPGLQGTVHIVSETANYDSGFVPLAWDALNGYYTYTWPTSGLEPSDDYGIEATLIDGWSNEDADGLPDTPDLMIQLVDRTPPEPISNLVAQQDPDDKTKVTLTWTASEPDSMIHIYRRTEPFTNTTDLKPIITVDDNRFIDHLPPEAGTYYYLVLIEDAAGNLNTQITPTNTASVTIPGPTVPLEPERTGEKKESDYQWLWWFLGVIIVIIILAILSAAYFGYRRKKEDYYISTSPPQVSPAMAAPTIPPEEPSTFVSSAPPALSPTTIAPAPQIPPSQTSTLPEIEPSAVQPVSALPPPSATTEPVPLLPAATGVMTQQQSSQ
ncbi:M14 family zinc carboxypeptidase [[Eubacterium] cellulosolvens]